MDTQESSLIVVGIGASAGGLDALREFFTAVPADSGMAFVVIQHLDPNHESYMADLLARCTAMKVVQAEHGRALAADCVYTIPPNKFMTIRGGRLYLSELEKRDGLRMPIDFFFRSLAEDQREKAVCVIFSGSGSDGTLGLREVRGAGGMTIVQKPETAQFDAMLKSAIATGMVDRVLPLSEIPEAIRAYKRRANAEINADDQAKLDTLDTILDLLATRSDNNFAAYKKTTLLRRADRRMGINHIASLPDYARWLQTNPDEIDQLAKDMLIGVSSFFRDAEAFEELRRSVIAPLVRERAGDAALRAWIPGCATGEEAYSIAILMLEELAAADKNCPIQIFASDIDSDALQFARNGIYPQSIAADVSEARLHRFFARQDSTYQVTKRVRESVIFSAQNLLTEAPFSRLDLISCRNLLIYIEPAVQRRLLAVFAFALSEGGHLFLGKSDGMASQSPLFTALSAKWRIYRRGGGSSRPPEFSLSFGGRMWGIDPLQQREPAAHGTLSELNQEVLLSHFDASVVLIDEHANILHFYGATGKYIEHPTGEATLNLLNLVENRLSAKIRVALRKLINDNKPVTLERVRFGRDGSGRPVDITIRAVNRRTKDHPLFAVIFEDARAPVELAGGDALADGGADDSLAAQLESELKSLKSEFQTTIDEYETSAEELKAANEEILSINEELQSTNEELETSKEEIQAVNEELNTVNSQLNQKLEELTAANNDLGNFLNSSQVATIFLDKELRIKRFTPSATNLMNLIAADLGRPIAHMTHKFAGLDLVAEAENVLRSVTEIEKEAQASDGRWYVMQCLPYRTMDNKIDGVIFTFNDVTLLKQSQISMEAARNFAEGIIETMRESLLVLNSDLRVVSANRAFYTMFRAAPQDTRNRSIFELGDRQWDIPRLRELLEKILPQNREFNDLEIEHEFPAIGRRRMLLNARRIHHDSSSTELILLTVEDITERERLQELLTSEEQLRQHTRNLEQQLIASGRLVSLGEITASMAHEFNNPLGIVMGFAQDLLSETDASSPQYQPLKIINEETKRCQKIIRDLMEFARPGTASPGLTEISGVIDTTLQILENRLYKQKVTLTKQMQPDLPSLNADTQQLEQVLINLFLNALDAMPDGGTLGVSAATDSSGGARPTVVVTVADSGMGITEDNRQRIFQPFFTTGKKTGLGLGLSICERIVKNHGGRIEVESRRGQGSTFKIYLPLDGKPEEKLN